MENENGKQAALITGPACKAEDARKEALKKASPAEQLIVQARSALVTRICEHNGWDADNLNSSQVSYIKAHPDWITPRIVKTTDGDTMNSVVIGEDWKNAVQSVIDSTESNSPVDGLLASITQFDPNDSDKLFAELTYAGLAGVPVIFTPIEGAERSELPDGEQAAPSVKAKDLPSTPVEILSLRIWHATNPPCKVFRQSVLSVQEAVRMLALLASYDLYLGDLVHANAQGLEIFDGEEWVDYYDHYGRDIEEIAKGYARSEEIKDTSDFDIPTQVATKPSTPVVEEPDADVVHDDTPQPLTDHHFTETDKELLVQPGTLIGPGGEYTAYYIGVRNNTLNPVIFCGIPFQNGSVKEVGTNGVTEAALVAITLHRLQSFQSGPYECFENARVIYHLENALKWMKKRAEDRENRGVEGTSEV